MKVAGLDAPRPEPRPLRGIVLMVCAVTLFSVMDSGAKYLSERYPVLLVVWARFFFNVLIMLVVLGPVLGLDLVRTRRPVLQLVRGLALGCSSVLFVSALPWMRLADASAVTFVTPMLVTLGAVYLYRHKAPSGTWLALVVSFIGVLMVIRPGGDTFTWAALLPLGTAVFASIYQLLTSRLAGVDNGTTSLFIGALVSVAVVSLAVPFVWVWPRTVLDGLLFVSIGAVGAYSHYLIILAYNHAPPAMLAPFAYMQIVGALVMGWLVFGNFPDVPALAGMALIAFTGVVMALRRRRGSAPSR